MTDNFNLNPLFIKFRSSDIDKRVLFDISMNPNGLRKPVISSIYLKKDLVYFMVILSLVKWARASELKRPFATAEKRD